MTWFQTIFNFLALSLLRLFAFLPYSIIVPIGYGLGWLAAHIPNERAHVVKTNLRLCFPSLGKSEIDALALEHWKLFGRSVIERSRIWLGTGEQIQAMVEIESAIPLTIGQTILPATFSNLRYTLVFAAVSVTIFLSAM